MGLAWGRMGLAWGYHGVGMGLGLAWGGMGPHEVGMGRMGPHGDKPTGPQQPADLLRQTSMIAIGNRQ
jgi:hypothetical protein